VPTDFDRIAASAFVVACARVVASFARSLVSADTADTAHRRLLSLILADSAHTVGRVDDDSQSIYRAMEHKVVYLVAIAVVIGVLR